jgi:hypothetical protein
MMKSNLVVLILTSIVWGAAGTALPGAGSTPVGEMTRETPVLRPQVAAGAQSAVSTAPAPEAPEWAELFGDASLPVVWQSAQASTERIAAALAVQRMDGVADWAETIHLAAHALMDQVRLPDPERQKRLAAALRQAAMLADEVLDGAQHEEAARAAAAFKRLSSALTLARHGLPKDITAAPAGQPRFAKASAHGDHDH